MVETLIKELNRTKEVRGEANKLDEIIITDNEELL